jgi:class 3 adenylate cyclase/CHASE2 domain-containing sensor protein
LQQGRCEDVALKAALVSGRAIMWTRERAVIIGFVAAAAAALTLHVSDLLQVADLKLLDYQFGYLRQYFPRPAARDVIVVGIDQATVARLREPFALWHPHLGKFLRAMSVAKPSAVGLDVVLPDKSYQFLIPEYDRPLLEGLAALRGTVPLVLAQTPDQDGKLQPVFPPFVSLAGSDSLGSAAVCLDVDGVARRVADAEEHCLPCTREGILAAKLADRLAVTGERSGLVDYALGGDMKPVPLHRVLDWYDARDTVQLRGAFRGRPVLLGVTLPFVDRLSLPVPLHAGEPNARRLPGVLFQAQLLKSMLNGRLVQPGWWGARLLLVLAGALFWWGRGGWIKSASLAAFMAATLCLSTLALYKGRHWPVTDVLASAALAFAGRLGYEGARNLREKRFLRKAFGGYVSPSVLSAILSGRIRPGLGGVRQHVCVLFSDIRDFTARSERMPAELVITLLNDYLSAITRDVHGHEGSVDKFIGDGVMALFGAPQRLECPELSAVRAAQKMLESMEGVNARLRERGVEAIRIGIGLHSGEVILGHVGSESRHEYTAIGDVVNLASRIEGLTKDSDCPVLCSAAVAAAVGDKVKLVDLGCHEVKGHTPVHVFGWRPPSSQDAVRPEKELLCG